MEYIKQDDNTLKVVTQVEVPQTEEKTYDYDFLKSQEVSILKSKNDFIQARDKELDEVRGLLAQCEALGIKSKVESELAEQQAIEQQLTK